MTTRDGLLLVDKPAGCTSHDVVQRARRILQQRKIGHCGTLDPDATGLLLLTLGKATRLTRFLIKAPKTYIGTIQLGTATDTYDASGEVTSSAACDQVTREQLGQVMSRFVGTYEQRPPAYSAKKIKGKRYFELARKGESVPDSTSPVEVFSFAPQGPLEDGLIAFRLACASGTYARSLAHDTGAELGCGAHLASLRRTLIGSFRVEDAAELTDVHGDAQLGEGGWVPFDEISLPFGQTVVDAVQERRLLHGNSVLVKDLNGELGDWVKLLSQRNQFLAVGLVSEHVGAGALSVVQPKIVFA